MIEIKPLQHCDAVVTLPGSKSLTHRALIVSALADGRSILVNALRSEDTEHTAQGLEKFGVPTFWEADLLYVLGQGGRLREKEETIFVGNSGTSMRFLGSLAALKKGRTLLEGDARMTRRPMDELLATLETLGVQAYSEQRNGCPPVIVESQGLKGGRAKIDSQKSSQFLSGLLMVAPYAETDIHLTVSGALVSRPYVEMTLNVMSAFGVEVQRRGAHSYSLRAGQRYRARRYVIEGDASNASYFFSAAAITHGRVRIENFCSGSLQGDVHFPDILQKMGCEVNRGDTWTEVRGKELYGIEIDMNEMPDLVPTLAVTAAFARGETVIKNIGHLRGKESDRIRALAQELTKMGIRAEEGESWLKVEGGEARGTEIETYKDHRIAMSFAIAGLAVADVKIKGEQSVNKSFPDFWKTFGRLYL